MSRFGALLSRFPQRGRGLSLRRSLPASFAGVALLTVLVLGGILLPVLGGYYGRSELSYLRAGSAQAVQDLSAVNWTALASGTASAADQAAAARAVQAESLATQLRIQVYAGSGDLLADSGRVSEINAAGVVAGREEDGVLQDQDGMPDGKGRSHGLPSPLGAGLFGNETQGGSQSNRTVSAQLAQNGQTVATVRVSEAPGYSATIVRSTLIGWLVAGAAAVLLAALVGWLMSRRLTRPLLAITAASDSMARGDLSVRAPVVRTDEIGTLAGSFNAMAETTQQTVSALRRFVGDAAHELGTPLTALRSDLELAQRTTDDPEVLRLMQRAIRQADRLERQSSDLLRLSRLETGAVPMDRLDLVSLVHRLADGFASRAEHADIELALDLPATGLPVRGYEDGLQAAVGNLLDNAIKFTPAGGSVTLGVKADGQSAVVWVEDTGIGVPSGDLDALFSRFHRGRNAAAYPGSGLGLAIVRATMEAHHGSASVHSRTPSGSRFELRLPLL